MLKRGTEKGENPMKLKSKNGLVPFLMVAGKDIVSSEMLLAEAERFCAKGTEISTRFPGYPISVKDKYYFAGVSTKPKTSKRKSSCKS